MNLMYYDLETTGISLCYDRIVSIGIIFNEKPFNILVNPERPIPSEASKIHKIYDRDVELAKPFSHYAHKLLEMINLSDVLIGYNNVSFDNVMLYNHFLRCGIEMPDKPSIDIYKLWTKLEPKKTLSSCYFRYFNESFDNAHTSEADILSTKLIFNKMMELHKITIDEAFAISNKKY